MSELSYNPEDFFIDTDEFDDVESDANEEQTDEITNATDESSGDYVQEQRHSDVERSEESEDEIIETPQWKMIFLLVLTMIVVVVLFFTIVVPALDNSNHSFATDVLEKSNEDGYWKDVLREAN